MSESKPNTIGSKLYNIREFCENNDISRAFLYLLWKRGDGPRYLDLGRRKITVEAEAEWRGRMEAKAAQKLGKAA